MESVGRQAQQFGLFHPHIGYRIRVELATTTHTGLDCLERALAAMVRALAARSNREHIARLSGHDLPAASWAMLEMLDGHDPIRLSDLAAGLGVDPSTATARVQALLRAGLVDRAASPKDARVVLISISIAGAAALGAVHTARRELLASVMAPGTDPAALETAARLLDQIATALLVHRPCPSGRGGRA